MKKEQVLKVVKEVVSSLEENKMLTSVNEKLSEKASGVIKESRNTILLTSLLALVALSYTKSLIVGAVILGLGLLMAVTQRAVKNKDLDQIIKDKEKKETEERVKELEDKAKLAKEKLEVSPE